eukprot:CAMPEP_0172448690 /NCGR_PEP_ID=MMETSP1065-20121228/7646_1 /TAXON_ID=265537 /ORGANISM="Amphiprora paludosa, Strain CCMP125" /LENGTH=652 /DNA_ID=CAMNT_0013200251 /DNA_START=80 /DNA_END=2038 /DNA_ORIENTATION=+
MDDDYSSSRSRVSSSSSSGGPSCALIRRREEFVYIPHSFRIDQSLSSWCCFSNDEIDHTPVMLRNEKALQRARITGSKSRMKRLTRIMYVYAALFLFLALHSVLAWRDRVPDEEKTEPQKQSIVRTSEDTAAPDITRDETVRNPLSFSYSSSINTVRRAKETPSPGLMQTPAEEQVEEQQEDEDATQHDEPQQPQLQQETEIVENQSYLRGQKQSVVPLAYSKQTEEAAASPPIRRFPYNAAVHFDAFDTNGNRNYVADPTALKRARQEFISNLHVSSNTDMDIGADTKASDFWATMNIFQTTTREGTRSAHIPITSRSVCSPGPGQGMEDEGGYKLFAEKIQLAEAEMAAKRNNNDFSSAPRLLCAIYSHASMYDLARTAALTWGHECDGFLVFGDAPSIPELGFVQLDFKGEESYNNMWQKVRSIWAYLHHNYRDDYDFFHLGGDDMYVIPENLRYRLAQKTHELQQKPEHYDPEETAIFMGQQVPSLGASSGHRPYIAGGPGYTLNRMGLHKLVREALPNCHVDKTAPYEDRLITACLSSIGVEPTDSRDPITGEQTYHGVAPHTLYTTRANSENSNKKRQSFHANAVSYWSKEPHPMDPSSSVGPKQGLDSAARYSVSFHNLFHPVFMARAHTLLHPNLCGATIAADQ